MRRSPTLILILLALFLGACSTKKKTPTQNAIQVRVERGTAPAGIDHVDLEVSGTTPAVEQTLRKLDSQNELELPATVRIVLPDTARGMVMVTGVARNAAGAELARGSIGGQIATDAVLVLTLGSMAASSDAGVPNEGGNPANLSI